MNKQLGAEAEVSCADARMDALWSADSTFSASADQPFDSLAPLTVSSAPAAVLDNVHGHDWSESVHTECLHPPVPAAPDVDRRELGPPSDVTFSAADLTYGTSDGVTDRRMAPSDATPPDTFVVFETSASDQLSAEVEASSADAPMDALWSADSTFSAPVDQPPDFPSQPTGFAAPPA
eukprot:scaffold22130_cov129-Isochrysis_galbana.AAC.1